MNRQVTVKDTLKHPSAFLPIIMSLLAVTVVGVHIILDGTARQADEGTAAHLWQLLMGGQVPIVGFFGIRWLPRLGYHAVLILVLQIVAALCALAPVYVLKW